MQSVKHDQKGRWTLYTNGGNQTKTIGCLPKWLTTLCSSTIPRCTQTISSRCIYIYTYIPYIYICISIYHVIGYYVNRTETTCTSLQNWFQHHRIFLSRGALHDQCHCFQMMPNDAKWCQNSRNIRPWIIQWIRRRRLVQLVTVKPSQEIQVPQAMPLYPRYGYNSLIPIHSSRVPSYPAAETGLNWDWCRWCIANPLLYPLQCTAWSKALLDDLDGEEWQVMQSAQGAYCKWVSS